MWADARLDEGGAGRTLRPAVARFVAPFRGVGVALALAGCAPAASSPTPGADLPAKAAPVVRPPMLVRPSRLLPEPDAELLAMAIRTGEPQRQLESGLRILVHASGAVERGDQRFAPGAVYAVELPERLGAGFLFHQQDDGGTRLWRAASWVAPLVPVASIAATIREVVVGFDRLYLRSESSSRLVALDPGDGRVVDLGGLPIAGGFGSMVFADGWRGVVDTELRGPLATFDAGWSWHPLGLADAVEGVGIEEGSPVVHLGDGRVRIDPAGHLQRLEEAAAREGDDPASHDEMAATAPPPAAHPLGANPLRTAVLSGWPDSPTSAVVATAGSLVRVSLPEARVLRTVEAAYPERDAQCTGARVGAGYGFVCVTVRGATSIYETTAPLGLRLFARFEQPRFVSSSGNGAFVVRGSCTAEAPTSGQRTYCIVGVDGRAREVGVRGDLGAERLVALADGRVVVLVPPRLGAVGRITVITGDRLTTAELRFADREHEAVRVAERGLWLEGFEQRGSDAVGGWIEAGGPVLGVEVRSSGAVRLGQLVELGGPVLLAGPIGIAVSEPEGAMETTDGGRSWQPLELPSLAVRDRDSGTRGCSPVGCALRGWVRVGWGPPSAAHDLGLAPEPKAAVGTEGVIRPVRVRCRLEPPDADPRRSEPPAEPQTVGAASGAWTSFLGLPPPRLGRDDEGVAKGTSSYDPVPAHAYAWGPKGADWARAGLWQLRFGDRFAPRDAARSSLPSRSPWADRDGAAQEIGVQGQGGYWRWIARLDPAGRCALLSACLGASCRLYSVCDAMPILPVRDSAGKASGLPVPASQSAVRVGESWYFLTEVGRDAVELWRIELGVAERLGRYPRLDRRGYTGAAAPALVRRAFGRELGLLVATPPDPTRGSAVSSWVVLPIDRRTAELGEPVVLGPADLGGVLPPPCASGQDGWLAELELETATVVDLPGARAYLDGIEYRLRLQSDGACTDAIAARATRAPSATAGATGEPGTESATPPRANREVLLVARDAAGGSRTALRCVAAE